MKNESNSLGNNSLYSTEYRFFDARLGRWMSLDPLMDQFPWMSPFVGMDNNPISLTDPLGLSTDGGVTEVQEVVVTAKRIIKDTKPKGFFAGLVGKVKSTVDKLVKNVSLFKLGFANAWASNQIFGAGRGNPERFGKDANIVQAGQTSADLVSIATGAIEVIDGSAASSAGVVLSGTGVGAIVGVPVTAGGVVVATHGSTVIGTATANIIKDGIAADKGGGSSSESDGTSIGESSNSNGNTDQGVEIPKGFKETKQFGKQHGQKVYQKNNRFISRDIGQKNKTSHNGGVWKEFKANGKKLKRIGTLDKDLNLIKK